MRALAVLALTLCVATGSTTASAKLGSPVQPGTEASGETLRLGESDLLMLGGFADSSTANLGRALREAVRAALDESPYLNLIPDGATERLLRDKTTGSAEDALLSMCQVTRAKAYITGTIWQDTQNANFEGRLSAIHCASHTQLATERFTGAKHDLIDQLGLAANRLRLDLGEPRASAARFSTRLSQATSASFEALDAWSSGLQTWRSDGPAAALPLLESAVREDPAFAAAIFDLGLAFRNSGQEERARELFTRAFAMPQRATSRKRLAIAAQYQAFVTVDEKRAVSAFQAWTGNYPRDYKAVSNFGSFYGDVCRYKAAIAQFERARQMNPDDVVTHEDLMEMLLATNEIERVRAVYRDVLQLKLDDDSPHLYMYVIAALQNDSEAMAVQSKWFEGKKDLQHEVLSEEADAAAYYGRLQRARELTERAVASANSAGNREQAAGWLLNSAWREDLFGYEQRAQEQAIQALAIAPASREGEATAAIILARTGDIGRAETLMADLQKRYPNHSIVQSYWLPTIRAQIALKRGNPAAALKELRTAAPLDLLYPQVFFYSHVPSVVLRAEAYTRAGQMAAAAEQWQTILRNPGIAQLSATLPFAKLQIGRVHAKTSRLPLARDEYRDFLRSWKDAEPGIPLLKEAQSEMAQLQ